MNRKDKWLWFATLTEQKNGITIKRIRTYEEINRLYESSEEELKQWLGMDSKEIKQISESKREVYLDEIKEKMEKENIHFVTIEDDEYPNRLNIYNERPLFLFYKGSLPNEKLPSVGMVGARACSNYGRTMARKIANELSSNHVQIISGMARGVDTYSQIGAIEGKTPTFAVLGCGVDRCYPVENIELYDEIIKNGGGIISEYMPGSPPLNWHFPLRNRIISGLSDKIAVIEAREKSGSLITVEWALEMGIDVVAVPGRVGDSLSRGCNRLIKSGAGVLTEAKDILDDFNIEVTEKLEGCKKVGMDEVKLKIYSILDMYPKSISEVIMQTKLEYGVVVGTIMELQMLGLVDEVGKNYYVRN